MDLDFSDEQEALREGVRSVLEREWPAGELRRLVETRDVETGDVETGDVETGDVETGDRAPVAALWRRLVDLDWPGLVVPEQHGGLGLGAVELTVLAEELGRVVAPGPLLPTLSQFVPAVRELGDPSQQARFLAPVASGGLTGALAVAEGTQFDPVSVTATARAEGDAVVVAGKKRFVAEAGAVDELAVVARLPETEGGTGGEGAEGLVVVVVPAARCTITPLRTLDATREYATVTIDDVRVEPDRLLASGRAPGAVARAIEEATVAVAVETLGTCQAILDMSVAYAKEREQFGRPIGSFQAVKHKLAEMLLAVERARASCYFAAACIAEDDPRRSEAVSVAKAAAGDAQRLVAEEAIQLHGGIGYTWEHDLQLFVKRAKSGDAVFGTAAEHRARLAAMVTGRIAGQVAGSGTAARWSDGR